ncbi:MAG: hypothetical protein COB83_04285 [Gammaproteobacteria bacterium]|nr:MAG: hypothetical protein COB83_04285 [Gammaproteobacteria bacterium]
MQVQTLSETRANFKAAIQFVSTHHEPMVITNKTADVVMMSKVDFDSMQETMYLLSSPNNAFRLMESIAQFEQGSTITAESSDNGEYKKEA